MTASAQDPDPVGARDSLLNAAEVEIGASGADGASLRAVARRAGVSHQAPAYHFVNRRGMFTALATRYVERLGAHLERAAAERTALPPLERLVEIGMTYVEFAHAHPALFSLTASPDQVDVHDPAMSAARERAWAVLHDVVEEAQRTGWRADQPTAGVAMTCWVLVHGSAALWREGWLTAQFPEAAVRPLVRGMLTSLT